MKLLIEIQDLDKYTSRQKLPIECNHCHETFYVEKHYIQPVIKHNSKKYQYCSNRCRGLSNVTQITCICKNCNKEFYKILSYVGENNFCSQRCAGIYNSQHRTTGTSRSKLEKWLELQLTVLYPKLKIKYNDTSAILAELDIYIPSLQLAFELNGSFHYEPIFGLDKLTEIQKRDKRKILTCAENNIELVVIDSSTLKYFKPINAKKFLDIIINIIDDKIGAS